LFLHQIGGGQRGYSFNAPIWSVSVEVIIYAVFLISIPAVSKRPLLMLFIAAFFMLLLPSGIRGSLFWQCGAYFFLGCFVFKMWATLDSRSIKLPLFVGIVGVILAVLAHGLIGYFYPGHGGGEITKLAAFPSLVLIAASIDRLDVAALGSKIRFVGDLTYSTYLWHVPVQILTLSLMEGFAFDRVVVSSEWFFVTFLITVFNVKQKSDSIGRMVA
jgi:peptidoglycan/LPS O-acetylase OafA/YrhL